MYATINNPNPLPSVEVLNEYFVLDSSSPSGLRLNYNPRGPWAFKGDVAGNKKYSGYWYAKVGGVLYSTSRMVWKMINGSDPKNVIDHIDGNPSNNSPSNLQDITQRQNLNKKVGEVIAA